MVSLAKLCRWLGLPRRSLYYRPKARQRVINTDLAARVRIPANVTGHSGDRDRSAHPASFIRVPNEGVEPSDRWHRPTSASCDHLVAG